MKHVVRQTWDLILGLTFWGSELTSPAKKGGAVGNGLLIGEQLHLRDGGEM